MCRYLTEWDASLTDGHVVFGNEWFETLGKISHYSPNEGGPNCANYNYVTKQCESNMASGEDWRLWEGCAVAVPRGYMYSLWQLEGGEIFIGLDYGGKIKTISSVVHPGKTAHWLDLLLREQDRPPVVYGTEIPVRFKFGTFYKYQ